MVDVSIVMPCLNESISLPHCIANAREALDRLAERHGWVGEIVVADNGSTDGSQELAVSMGARVVPATRRGYGAALRAGFAAARGRYLVMGDSDGSYDFRDAVAMVEKLADGADLCMGSRFKGGIADGAMPWKNRYIGNPVLTGILNLFYGTRISDAHCGLRALTRRTFETLALDGDGMEFASEMVVKAALRGLVIGEVPATLSPDLRDRPPHLRPWRDGWRHLRFMLLLCPTWLFGAPAAFFLLSGLGLLAAPTLLGVAGLDSSFIGSTWTVLAGALISLGHQALLMVLAAEIQGVREGFRRPSLLLRHSTPWLSLEVMLVGGLLTFLAGGAVLVGVTAYWSAHAMQALPSLRPVVLGTSLLVIGAQTSLCAFLLASIRGGDARLLTAEGQPSSEERDDRSSGIRTAA